MKNCGPLKFPAQNAKNTIAMTVDFFVNPETLLAASDSINGHGGELPSQSFPPSKAIIPLIWKVIVSIQAWIFSWGDSSCAFSEALIAFLILGHPFL
ncbi:hypothetical protein N7524_011319 [Penicillium chrysogenum]|nr:hypothetical protein N7524_011319 [Penicillium chrysogenum]